MSSCGGDSAFRQVFSSKSPGLAVPTSTFRTFDVKVFSVLLCFGFQCFDCSMGRHASMFWCFCFERWDFWERLVQRSFFVFLSSDRYQFCSETHVHTLAVDPSCRLDSTSCFGGSLTVSSGCVFLVCLHVLDCFVDFFFHRFVPNIRVVRNEGPNTLMLRSATKVLFLWAMKVFGRGQCQKYLCLVHRNSANFRRRLSADATIPSRLFIPFLAHANQINRLPTSHDARSSPSLRSTFVERRRVAELVARFLPITVPACRVVVPDHEGAARFIWSHVD